MKIYTTLDPELQRIAEAARPGQFVELFPEATILVTGVEDPYGKAHGPNESLHLGVFRRSAAWPA